MRQKSLAEKIKFYNPFNKIERKKFKKLLKFISNDGKIFSNNNLPGHITGSAWILNFQKTKVLLTHHVKLGIWIQLGGHADGSKDILAVTQREAEEESGLQSLTLLSEKIFDLDVHTIPKRKNFPKHFHYDVRFLYEADENEMLQISDESHDLKWVKLKNVNKYNNEPSIMRMVKKSRGNNLRNFLKKDKW
ncbi:MAG: NUDIX hydrolase [Candidatus Cloacimonetes bacterium]|nr:NUDIX hydrolase [Candidatus Cloacimonadota bacterium]MBS3767903.1 NUDIX hydrolase [Candidatus Cloacimonadota bacterium]